MTSQVSNDLVHGVDVASSDLKILNNLITKYSCIRNPNQPPDAAGDARYLTSLWVFGNREINEPESPPPSSFTKLMVDQDMIDTQMIKEKITSALKILSFREPRVFIQFWSPVMVRKRCLLMTVDQPFGLGMIDEGLYLYRRDSERRMFVVNGDYKEQDVGPPGRVYQQKMPEFSFDVHGLSTRQYAQDWAASYNIHGYINLPVFQPSGGCCVGVLELITSSNYVDYAFEVRKISRALKEVNLKCPNVFEDPSFSTGWNERRQHEEDQIFRALKTICDIQNLPLAQTWALSGYSSFVAYSGNLEQSCCSFNKNCIGKVCMATTGLPFYVRDLSMWAFREACNDQHLEKSQGVVGRSLSSGGSYFCENVMQFSEDEYPLIHIASMNGITGCFAIYLKSIKDGQEYIIEFYLPPHGANMTYLKSLVEIVIQEFKNATDVQLGVMSSTQVIGRDPFNWNLESLPEMENEQNDAGVTSLTKPMEEENDLSSSVAVVTSQNIVPCLGKHIEDSDISPRKRRKIHSEISHEQPRRRKKSDRAVSLEEIRKHYGKTLEEASAILNISRSTLKRICRSHGVPRWPYSKGPSESDSLLKSDQTDMDVIHASEGTLTLVSEPRIEPSFTTNRTHEPVTLTQDSSTPALKQWEQTTTNETNISKGKEMDNIATNKEENVDIKVAYRDNIVKFSFHVSDGLGKLEGLVATRFQLKIGSFNLKYVDEEGDMILIACDSDLTGFLAALRRLNVKTVIKLLVQPVAGQTFVWSRDPEEAEHLMLGCLKNCYPFVGLKTRFADYRTIAYRTFVLPPSFLIILGGIKVCRNGFVLDQRFRLRRISTVIVQSRSSSSCHYNSSSLFLLMKILKENVGTLTDFEVLDFLCSRGAAKDPTHVLAPIAPSEFKVYDYLVQTAACSQTRECIAEFVTKCKPYKLTKSEITSIINIRPSSAVEIDPMADDLDTRLGESVEELVELVLQVFHPFEEQSKTIVAFI